MMKRISYQFVDIIPDNVEPDVLYISTEYKTTIHLCFCGCGNEVALPLSPYDWKLIFDGEGVSLYPSVGCWGLPCQSHYWIEDNCVQWAPIWNGKQIEQERKRNAKLREEYFNRKMKKESPLSFLKRFTKD